MLGKQQIIHAMTQGRILIEPFNIENLGTNSYDVCLGEWYYAEQSPDKAGEVEVYNIYDEQAVNRVWGKPQKAVVFDGILSAPGLGMQDKIIWLGPGETILAHTQEFIGGRMNVTSMMKARSSFGRNFIEVCKCAGLGDVGYCNRWTMEITNNSRFYTIPLIVGRRIAQITFFECDAGGASYENEGKYQVENDYSYMVDNWEPEDMLPRLYMDRELRK